MANHVTQYRRLNWSGEIKNTWLGLHSGKLIKITTCYQHGKMKRVDLTLEKKRYRNVHEQFNILKFVTEQVYDKRTYLNGLDSNVFDVL